MLILWGAGSADEPNELFHGHTDALCEGGNLTLEINKKGFWAPSADDIDGDVRLASLVKSHGAAWAEIVRANLVRVKP